MDRALDEVIGERQVSNPPISSGDAQLSLSRPTLQAMLTLFLRRGEETKEEGVVVITGPATAIERCGISNLFFRRVTPESDVVD